MLNRQTFIPYTARSRAMLVPTGEAAELAKEAGHQAHVALRVALAKGD